MAHIKLLSLLSEGFKSNSGLAKAIRMYKKESDSFPGDKSIIDNIRASKLISDDIFHFAALFPRDTFKIDYIRNGKLESEIKRLYFNGDNQKIELEKAKALKEFVLALDKYYGEKNWPAKF